MTVRFAATALLLACRCGAPPPAAPRVAPPAAPTTTTPAGAQAPAPPPDEIPVAVETLSDDVVQPVSLAFTPEGDLFISEKQTGRIRLIRHAAHAAPAAVAVETIARVGPVDPRSERGLLGLAVHPHWARGTRLLYAYYTAAGEPVVQRVVAFAFDPALSPPPPPRTILDGLPAGPPGGLNHDGGVLVMRDEGGSARLYVHVGDNAVGQSDPVWPHPSQETLWRDATPFPAQGSCPARAWTLQGKILRVTDDGRIPEDNPAPCSPIYALGLRNGYGLGFHPRTGDLWMTDNGNERDEEVNRIEAGRNYGWPCMHGDRANDDDPGPPGFWGVSRGACTRLRAARAFTGPAFVDPGTPGADNTPGYAGLAFVTRCEAYGPSYVGNLVWASSDGRIFRGVLAPPDYRRFSRVDVRWLRDRFPVDVEEGPDGRLYVADIAGAVRRIVPALPVPPEACAGARAGGRQVPRCRSSLVSIFARVDLRSCRSSLVSIFAPCPTGGGEVGSLRRR